MDCTCPGTLYHGGYFSSGVCQSQEVMEMNDNAIAIVEYKNGKQRAIKGTYNGGLYLEWLNYDGLFLAGATDGNDHWKMKWLQDEVATDEAKIVQSRFGNLYHCWHVCYCEECARWGGKAFDHSQASFNAHLKFTPSDKLFTFPTV